MSTQAQKDARATTHPLLSREIRPLSNWHEWLVRWQAAVSIEEMLGLLHVGFNVSIGRHEHGEQEYDDIDRLVFYFSIADGWNDHYLLEFPTDQEKYPHTFNSEQGSPGKLRQQLARKAFDMLCLNFFKVELLGGGRYGDSLADIWESVVVSERFFPIIQNFFRAGKRRYSDSVSIRNLSYRGSRSHNEEHAVNFLLDLVRFIWGYKTSEPSWRSDEELKQVRKDNAVMRSRLDASKPWMVEVLVCLDKLDLLREWILDLDKPCLEKLKEIALRNRLSEYTCPVRKSRTVATLDEACYLDSKAAWFLKEHELRQREHRRLTAIRDAEQAKAKADQKIKELTPKK